MSLHAHLISSKLDQKCNTYNLFFPTENFFLNFFMLFKSRLKGLQYDISLDPFRWLFAVPWKKKKKNTAEYKVPPHFSIDLVGTITKTFFFLVPFQIGVTFFHGMMRKIKTGVYS